MHGRAAEGAARWQAQIKESHEVHYSREFKMQKRGRSQEMKLLYHKNGWPARISTPVPGHPSLPSCPACVALVRCFLRLPQTDCCAKGYRLHCICTCDCWGPSGCHTPRLCPPKSPRICPDTWSLPHFMGLWPWPFVSLCQNAFGKEDQALT